MGLNKVIVNCAIGTEHSWYHRGQKKLIGSLREGSYNTFLRAEKDECAPNFTVYEEKINAIKLAERYGSLILWLDCSITAVRPLDDIWKWIEEKGYYLYKSGYNCAQTSNDNALEFYGITRDEAEKMPECASNVVGFNLNHPAGKLLFNMWTESLNGNANRGVKWPTPEQRLLESKDPRFQFHRQDQTTLSLSAGKLGLEMDEPGHFVHRAESDLPMKESVIFVLKGGVGE